MKVILLDILNNYQQTDWNYHVNFLSYFPLETDPKKRCFWIDPVQGQITHILLWVVQFPMVILKNIECPFEWNIVQSCMYCRFGEEDFWRRVGSKSKISLGISYFIFLRKNDHTARLWSYNKSCRAQWGLHFKKN